MTYTFENSGSKQNWVPLLLGAIAGDQVAVVGDMV